ncbi:hypothetical protein QTP70_031546, partial [Hemibagrus guttatus]
MGVPQGTVLSLVLFILYTPDFQYNSESCNVQKFADDTGIVGCIRRRGQSQLYFLRRLVSFNISKNLLQMFYQTVVASALFYMVVCWGGSIKKKDASHLDKLDFSSSI